MFYCLRQVIRPLQGFAQPVRSSSMAQATSVSSTEVDAPETVLAESLQHPDFFAVRDLVQLHELFEARVHLGHKEGLRDDRMAPYLFGCRQGVDIIDLDKTVPLLQDALNVTAHVAFRGGIILFISRQRLSLPLVEGAAQSTGEYAHCRYWAGGTFTNLRAHFGAVTRLPDLCIFPYTLTGVLQSHTALKEAAAMMIPTVGVLDSNCDPSLVTYPVPGNDDTPSAVQLYLRLFTDAINRGKQARRKLLAGDQQSN